MHSANSTISSLPRFRRFWRLRRRADVNISFTLTAGRPVILISTGAIMDETIQKSCWAVTFKALAGFAVVLALAYLFGTI